MSAPQTKVENLAVALSETAFGMFCEDVSGMFEVEMQVSRQESIQSSLDGLKKHFSQVVLVNCVKAEGSLEGTFQLIFDQHGLFTLAGVILMLPEKTLLEYLKRGTAKDAQGLGDAMGEMGNLLVGSWDRVFRDAMPEHGHFTQQLPTFIGQPWLKTQEIGLARDEQFTFVPYEMTVGPYPPFQCGVIFPRSVFPDEPESDSEEDTPVEPGAQAQGDTEQAAASQQDSDTGEASSDEQVEAVEEAETIEAAKVVEESEAAEAVEALDNSERVDDSQAEPVSTEQTAPPEPQDASEDVQAQDVSQAEAEPESDAEREVEQESEDPNQAQAKAEDEQPDKAEQTNEKTEPSAGKVSQTIAKMTKSPADLPGEGTTVSLAVCAQDIMQQEVVWANPEDSVEQAIAKMQQHDVGYMLAGSDGIAEGIVSRSDISGATSPYLRPIFAKWRRPLDDATLQIKIKWIMTRPVRTINPETSLAGIMENMSRSGGRCLPVADEHGKIQGLVTVYDIFKALLNHNSIGPPPQAPQLI